MKRTALVSILFSLLLVYSCSVDDIDISPTQSIATPTAAEPIKSVTKTNAEVLTKTISDTLLQNKKNKALMMEMEGNGELSLPEKPRK